MSIYDEPDYGDYFGEPSAFDQEVEAFKQSLRDSVKEEVREKISTLQKHNGEQADKLQNLKALELAAEQKRIEYERKLGQAEREAEDKVKKEGIRKLLDVLAEPRYRIDTERRPQPKCNKCNEDRKLKYTTPRGRIAYEPCECAATTLVWTVQEQYVHEVTKRFGQLVVWYDSTARWHNRDNPDSISNGTVLKSPAGVPIKELMDEPREYGFANKEDALMVASALNKEPKKEVTWA